MLSVKLTEQRPLLLLIPQVTAATPRRVKTMRNI